MPELPDIYLLARSMDEALRGRRIAAVDVHQPRCLNLPPEDLARAVRGAAFVRTWQRGKWALARLDSGDILAFNLGMGGEVRLHSADETSSPQRERVTFRLDDGQQLWVHFWWFGQVHLIAGGNLGAHPQVGRLGAEPLAPEFTVGRLGEILAGRRGALKKYLLDQTVIAGIGNVYVQDILWHARLHPLAMPRDLNPEDIARLHAAIQHVLREGIRWGGGPREQDIWGHEGTYTEHLQVGYRTGQPCPACGTAVEEIRVGATTSYICHKCQARGA
jgi:formamidopyrimidine-DNA glycosylase